ncbi:MAG: selenide, water dikinase SelD [Bacteroidales bacterium]|nr:selenide, water dikinase SelD [Candidatus Latescibacterota bacterium]
MSFDLLTTVEYGGCSAKLPARKLSRILDSLPRPEHPDLLVGIDTSDDAGVYRISADLALIQTTDFFPPICSDAYEFGQIAAANALSDVYAMGGEPLTALNIIMFPDNEIPMEVYRNILLGGHDKVTEAGAVIVGGHTLSDSPPKYGLSVTGKVHPDRMITNDRAKQDDVLILTKPIGTGVICAGHRLNLDEERSYRSALENMKQLNRAAAEMMQKYDVRCATDITGFGLLGHATQLARASGVTLEIESGSVPLLNGAYSLTESGCIPGAAFRNQEYAEPSCSFKSADYNLKMLMYDAQTSGGILMAAPPSAAGQIIDELKDGECPHVAVVGRVVSKQSSAIVCG